MRFRHDQYLILRQKVFNCHQGMIKKARRDVVARREHGLHPLPQPLHQGLSRWIEFLLPPLAWEPQLVVEPACLCLCVTVETTVSQPMQMLYEKSDHSFVPLPFRLSPNVELSFFISIRL